MTLENPLLKYILYVNLRNIVYDNVTDPDFITLNNNDKFVYLLSHDWKQVADFLDKAWVIRTDKLYDNR